MNDSVCWVHLVLLAKRHVFNSLRACHNLHLTLVSNGSHMFNFTAEFHDSNSANPNSFLSNRNALSRL